jgi:hypothetical protein
LKKKSESTEKGKSLKIPKTPPAPASTKPDDPNEFFLGTSNLELQFKYVAQSWGAMGVTAEDLKGGMEKFVEPVHAAIAGVNPRNEIEAMLAVQMVGAHNMAMEFSRRAMHPKQYPEVVDTNVARVIQVMRIFIEQVACLQKLKGQGSQQKVTVEHVHVHQGGQAIVGAVTSRGEGGRGNDPK